jgi:hypothetical protein
LYVEKTVAGEKEKEERDSPKTAFEVVSEVQPGHVSAPDA